MSQTYTIFRPSRVQNLVLYWPQYKAQLMLYHHVFTYWGKNMCWVDSHPTSASLASCCPVLRSPGSDPPWKSWRGRLQDWGLKTLWTWGRWWGPSARWCAPSPRTAGRAATPATGRRTGRTARGPGNPEIIPVTFLLELLIICTDVEINVWTHRTTCFGLI